MKKLVYLVYIVTFGMMLFLSSCGDLGDYPEKSDDRVSVDDYLLPKASVLTQEDRDLIQAERDEYEQATQGK